MRTSTWEFWEDTVQRIAIWVLQAVSLIQLPLRLLAASGPSDTSYRRPGWGPTERGGANRCSLEPFTPPGSHRRRDSVSQTQTHRKELPDCVDHIRKSNDKQTDKRTQNLSGILPKPHHLLPSLSAEMAPVKMVLRSQRGPLGCGMNRD